MPKLELGHEGHEGHKLGHEGQGRTHRAPVPTDGGRVMISGLIRFCLERKLVVFLALIFFMGWGILSAPFGWKLGGIDRDPVPVDAIPDIGENQQIVFTEWAGRSPQDVEDQVTYPLTVALLGVPEVKTVRSFSNFGFSTIYLIFNEDAEFYWTRSRILEKLNSLPSGTLPEGVMPALGPDATPLGQIFWYTLEGRDREGNATGGWGLDELRTIQDWYVRYALQGVEGVAEVASVGGFVKEYQVDVDPDAMRAFGVGVEQVYEAVGRANLDVGARTIELNRAEYVIRGLGFIKSVEDLRKSVVKVNDNVPVTLGQIAKVHLGPATRRGALDKGGTEAVGGVVVARYGENPMAVIERVKEKIESISPGLAEKTLADGTVSKVTIVPFYDRTGLIRETLGTLETALTDEMMVTLIVVIVMVLHLRSSLLIASMLPMAVLLTFIGMKLFGVDANIVALSGIAIAIGTIVDMGIVVTENTLKHLEAAPPEESRLNVVHRAATEVGSAVVAAVMTTVISFLPVFAMESAEGKLFRPLAYTKTFALVASIILALTVIPAFAHLFLTRNNSPGIARRIAWSLCILAGVMGPFLFPWFGFWLGLLLVVLGAFHLFRERISDQHRGPADTGFNYLVALFIAVVLAQHWAPLGPEREFGNVVFAVGAIGGVLLLFHLFLNRYLAVLSWCLGNKLKFSAVAAFMLLFGLCVWLGVPRVFGFVPGFARENFVWRSAEQTFPGLGKEFMPPLDEGSFLFMPTTMPHASIGEALDVLQTQDMAIRSIPEVESVVGKLGRAESPLDPAPVSMFETVINYKSEYRTDEHGRLLRFKTDRATGDFARDASGELIPDRSGRPFRQWREEIRTPDDIWQKIVHVTSLPGTTGAPKLQPIAARLVMLQSGMRAPMGLKIFGPDLETIEKTGVEIEQILKQSPGVASESVFADRIVGKPYLEIDIDRDAIARYGMTIRQVQDVIEIAVGGRQITTTVEGRERYPVRVRYLRELRDDIESIESILVTASDGAQIPLRQLATIRYRRGPQMIKSEDTFLVGYIIFDKQPGFAEVEVVEKANALLEEKRASGELRLPPGVSYRFTGAYENQVRAEKRLMLILPVALLAIFLILYFQFGAVSTALLVFTGILMAWSGGFIMLWLYAQPWFLDFGLFGVNLREVFQVNPINLSVAVWVGFLALFGIATDDGVIMGTYLEQVFHREKPASIEAIRAATLEAGAKRIRPCLMTVATTVLALLPILTSSGRGSDIMIPMAIPTFGGMVLAVFSVLVVPVLYCWLAEARWRRAQSAAEVGLA